MADRLTETRSVYERLKPWLLKYRGGMPVGFLAAIAQHESGGNPASVGDPSLGEFGYFQIESSMPPTIGWDPATRYDPESNIFLASIDYAIRAVQLYLSFPNVIRLGTADSWKCARLAFAVGTGGTKQLLAAATGGSGVWAGQGYEAVKSLAARGGAGGLGTQSASTVNARITDVDLQWAIGAAVAPAYWGPPQKTLSPGNRPYTLPASVAGYFSSIWKEALILGGLGLLLVAAGRYLLPDLALPEPPPAAPPEA